MDLNTIKSDLSEIANGIDGGFANAAQFIIQLIQQVESSSMSASEAAEALKDMQRQLDVVQEVERLALKERLNTIINGLIALAGAV